MRRYIRAAALIVSALLIICYANSVTDSFTLDPVYTQYPDAAGLYFLQGLNSNGLFPHDFITACFRDSLKLFDRNFIFLSIYNAFLRILPLPIAIKIVSVILCLAAVFLIYKIARRFYTDNQALFISGLSLIYFLSIDTFYAGQCRSFGAVIILLSLFLLTKGAFLFIPFLMPLAVYFYPAILVTSAISAFLTPLFFNEQLIRRKILRLFILLSLLCLAVSLIILFQSHFPNSIENNMFNLKKYGFQEYKYSLGRHNSVMLNNPMHIASYFIFNLNEHGKLYRYFTLFFISLCLIMMLIRKRESLRLPKAMYMLLCAAGLGFLFIYPVHPVSASRQFVFTMPLFLVFFICANLFNIVKREFNPALPLVPLGCIFLLLHPLYADLDSYGKYKPLYDYISKFPKDTLVAGYPRSKLTATIPLFTKRGVFYADEFRDILILCGDRTLDQRRQDVVSALYAGSVDTVKDFIKKYNVKYFIIEERFYSGDFIIDLYTTNGTNCHARESGHPDDNFMDSRLRGNDIGYATINKTDKFSLLHSAKKNYDFKLRIEGKDIYILNAQKIKE